MKAMRISTLWALALIALTVGLPSAAQEGHPLAGSWLGQLSGSDHFGSIVLRLEWDGEQVSGVLNPGPRSTPVRDAELDSGHWRVRFQVESPAESGEPTTYTVQAQLEDILMPNRLLVGTWTSESGSGTLQLRRQ
jgi:hypothetical protein